MAQASERGTAWPLFFKDKSVYGQGYEEGTIYPPRDKVFNALLETPFEEVRVVILP